MASLYHSYWRELLPQSIHSPYEIESCLTCRPADLEKVAKIYPMRISPYYAGLMQSAGDPIRRQAVPDLLELEDRLGRDDPLCEEEQSVVPNLIHRYPNRVVFLVSDQCAVYCRHCMRKRRVGFGNGVAAETLTQGINYIAGNTAVTDVILSGGDPLLLADRVLFDILRRLRRIAHVKIVRIHSRVPCTLPQRITPELVQGLRQFHPLWLNTQFNHPGEITDQAQAACNLLADGGIPLGCQTVLLKNVNDSSEILAELMMRLLEIRVRPYYLHHPDRVKGTRHFWVSLQKGIGIIKELRGRISGMAMPAYMVDLPGGGGKVPLLPESVVEKGENLWKIRNYEGLIFDYHLTI